MSRRKPVDPFTVTPDQHMQIMQRVRQEHLKYLVEQTDCAWIELRMPTSLPENWTIRQRDPLYGLWAISRTDLSVIMSGAVEGDGRRWLHVSCARPQRIPNWDDLKLVKSTFLGDEALAIQVFPPASQWVNINKFVLHLWSPVDELVIPDFTRQTGSI